MRAQQAFCPRAAILRVCCCAVAAFWAGLARAAPPADPLGIWTIQEENSSFGAGAARDKLYVNGLSLSWTSATDRLPAFLARTDHSVWGAGQERVTLSLDQQIYTPVKTELSTPDPNDRPYAGLLLANLTLLSDTDRTRSLIELSAGLVGPDSGGEALQIAFHHLIGQTTAAGWAHQITDTAAVEATAARTWRLPLPGPSAGLEADVLPAFTAGVGDLRDYAQAGVLLRLGEGLDSDFGPPRLRPGLSGEDAFVATREAAWYAFFGGDAQAVGYDLLLQAKPFRSGPHAPLMWDVAEGEVGFAALTRLFRLTFLYAVQSPEFRRQGGGPHQFFSASIAFKA